MSTRTCGVTRTCAGCRHWSGQDFIGSGNVIFQALCLQPKPAPLAGAYTLPEQSCNLWASGLFGAIDAPEEGDAGMYEEYDAMLLRAQILMLATSRGYLLSPAPPAQVDRSSTP